MTPRTHVCPRCRVPKPLEAFYASLGACKVCRSAANRAKYLTDPSEFLRRQKLQRVARQRAATNPRSER